MYDANSVIKVPWKEKQTMMTEHVQPFGLRLFSMFLIVSILIPHQLFAKGKVLQLGSSSLCHGDYVRSVAFSQRGRLIASVSGDGKVRFWDKASGKAKGSVQLLRCPIGVDFLDSRTVVVAEGMAHQSNHRIFVDLDAKEIKGKEHRLIAIDIVRRKITKTLATYTQPIVDIKVCHKEGLVAIATLNQVEVRRLRDNSIIFSLSANGGSKEVAVSGNGRYLALANQGTLDVYEIKTKRRVMNYELNEPFGGVAISYDGRRTYLSGEGRNIMLFDTLSGKILWECFLEDEHLGHGDWLKLAVSPRNSSLLALSDRTKKLWLVSVPKKYKIGEDDYTKATFRELSCHHSPVACLAFSPRGDRLATGSLDNKIDIHRVSDGKPLYPDVRETTRGATMSVALSRDEKLIATANGNEIRLWNKSSGTLQSVVKVPSQVKSIDFSPDRDLLVAVTNIGTIHFINPKSGEETKTVKRENLLTPHCVKFANNDKLFICGQYGMLFWPDGGKAKVQGEVSTSCDDNVAVATLRGRVAICGTEYPTLKFVTPKGNYLGWKMKVPTYSLALTPDGDYAACGHEDGSITLWKVEDRSFVKEHRSTIAIDALSRLQAPVRALCFSGNGKILAAGGPNNNVYVYSVPSLKLLDTFTGHEGPIYTLACSRDGDEIVSGSADTTAILWHR